MAAIAVSNLIFYILPLSKVENYPPLAVALKLNQAWPHGTTVYFAPGVSGTISGTGKLLAEGTAGAHIRIGHQPGSGNWASLDFLNTTVVAVSVTVVSLFLNSLAAYAFSRLRFRGREFRKVPATRPRRE